MRPKYLINFSLCWLGIIPAHGLAVGPATQPSAAVADVAEVQPANADGNTTLPDDSKPHRPYGDGGMGRRMLQRFAPISEKDKADAMLYMKEHSPNRYAAIDGLPETNPAQVNRKNNVKELAARNYLSWMQIMKEDPELYAVIKDRVAIEDDIFGLVTDLHRAAPDKTDAIQAKLKDKVASLVDIGLQERELRLKRLQKTVEEQQQKLAEDSKRRADLIDERLKNILNEEKGLVPSNGTGGQHGHGPRPPGDNRPVQ
jgi:hypothetical protein